MEIARQMVEEINGVNDKCKHPRLNRIVNMNLGGHENVYQCNQCLMMLIAELRPYEIVVKHGKPDPQD